MLCLSLEEGDEAALWRRRKPVKNPTPSSKLVHRNNSITSSERR